MLRPATPLAVMLFAAFVLLLLSVLSTPLIKSIPLGSFHGFNFGVFGFCKPDGSCSKFELGYDTSTLFSSGDSATFDLPTSTRTTLSTILVLHPIAAFLTLVMLVMAFAAHFHSASHSVRYLLLVFIISIFTFLAALLAFLIDVLLFVPHMAWGSFITLAAACLVALSSIVSCAMRRTLVSRKSRQRRIAANAEMSGENFYNRQAQSAAAVAAAAAAAQNANAMDGAQSALPRQPTLPRLGGPSSNGDSFEKKDDGSSDEQMPLTAQTEQAASRYSLSSAPRDPVVGGGGGGGGGGPNAMMMSGAAGGAMPPRRDSRPPSVQRDAYGNPLPPYGGSMSPPPVDGYGMRRGPSLERMNNMSPSQRGRGVPGGYRGGSRRGSPGPYGPPPGRGGYGPPPGRGGYGPPPGQGGYGPPPGRGGYGGPTPPPNGRGRGGYGGRGGYPGPGRGGRTPPPGYRYDQPGGYGGPYGGMRGPSPGPASAPPGAYYGNPPMPGMNNGMEAAGPVADGYGPYRSTPVESAELPRAESPPPLPIMGAGFGSESGPLNEAVEMDATAARERQPQPQQRFADGDDDIAGMVGLQQGRTSDANPEHGSEADNQYVPVRSGWNAPRPANNGLPTTDAAVSNRPTTSEAYIEDVDPRFAEPHPGNKHSSPPPPLQQQPQFLQPLMVPPGNSYEDIPQGSRSPAESERSTFTSISQRGVNPRWNPPPQTLTPGYGPPGMEMGPGHGIPRRPVRDPNETLLNSNPDFSLPAAGRRSLTHGSPGPSNLGGGGGGGMIPGSAYPAM
ncbi:pH signal transduction protein [Niveomyces insectorum RCEF 264]|uniref:pH signal transduction protein n=1 Tax=Niveomyces insectorum RCEF 264 TaxID=1081102 RepID=A0A167VC32_9HYPO|nr:pH signal transduction protein [Niveomyces insectorum RCEF 264]